MKTSPLNDQHIALEAKMAPFAGWSMPIQYTSVIDEHECVRSKVGIFDVSHMGVVEIEGKEAESYLDFLSTNKIVGKTVGSATYTVFCNSDGGAVDDLIVYRTGEETFFVAVNAANREKDFAHMQAHAEQFEVKLTPRYDDKAIISVQGPNALELIGKFYPEVHEMKPMQLKLFEDVVVATTGYTGEKGGELIVPVEKAEQFWTRLLAEGKELGVQPIGLGARDTLRLEKGFALYGHELSDTLGPLESVSQWTVKFKERDFLGKEALSALKESEELRVVTPISLPQGVAREGYQVLEGEEILGEITSGTFSPSLKQSIALALLKKKREEGAKLAVRIRNRVVEAQVVSLPFVK